MRRDIYSWPHSCMFPILQSWKVCLGGLKKSMLCIVASHNVLCATDIVYARMFMPHDVECSRLDALSLFVLFYLSQGFERLNSAQTFLDAKHFCNDDKRETNRNRGSGHGLVSFLCVAHFVHECICMHMRPHTPMVDPVAAFSEGHHRPTTTLSLCVLSCLFLFCLLSCLFVLSVVVLFLVLSVSSFLCLFCLLFPCVYFRPLFSSL